MSLASLPGNWVDSTDTQGGVVTYRVVFSSPGASTPTTFLANSQITSVTYSATGVYTVVLGGAFYQVLDIDGGIMQASYSASGACRVRPVSAVGSTGTIVVTTETAAGAAVATASGDVVMFTFQVQTYRSPGNS